MRAQRWGDGMLRARRGEAAAPSDPPASAEPVLRLPPVEQHPDGTPPAPVRPTRLHVLAWRLASAHLEGGDRPSDFGRELRGLLLEKFPDAETWPSDDGAISPGRNRARGQPPRGAPRRNSTAQATDTDT